MEVLAAVFTVRPDRSGTGVPAGAAVATGAANRTPAGGRCPAASGAAPTRTSTPPRPGSWPRRSTCSGSPTWSRSGCSPTPERVPGRRGWWPPDSSAWCRWAPTRGCPRTPPGTRWTTCRRPRWTTASSSTGPTGGCRPSCPTPTSGSRWRPPRFTIAELRRVYAAALAHDVDPTNLQRILTRRGMLEPTGTTAASGPTGGRPAAMYRFTVGEYRVTDPFAAFRPPGVRREASTSKVGRPFQATRKV